MLSARGIDIDELTHVINYNLPDDNEVYVHRSEEQVEPK